MKDKDSLNWISVGEMLPDKHGNVLCYGYYNGYADETPSMFVMCFVSYWNNWKAPYETGPHVTHWMPLPDEPIEDARSI